MIFLKEGNPFQSDCDVILGKKTTENDLHMDESSKKTIFLINFNQLEKQLDKDLKEIFTIIKLKEKNKQKPINIAIKEKIKSDVYSWSDIYKKLSVLSTEYELDVYVFEKESENAKKISPVKTAKEKEKELKNLTQNNVQKTITPNDFETLIEIGKNKERNRMKKREVRNQITKSELSLSDIYMALSDYRGPNGIHGFLTKRNPLDDLGIDYEDIDSENYYLVYVKEGIAIVPYYHEPDVSYQLYEEPRMMTKEEAKGIEKIILKNQQKIKEIENKCEVLKFVLEKQKLRTLF